MITLGITGRSGCGKSTVTSIFAAHGVPLADADQMSREILLPGSPLLPRLVTAPFATSVARIAARDGISPEMAARRLNAQTPEETLRAHADYVLCNDGALEALEASANTLCEQLLAEAAGKDGVARPF